MAKLKVLAPNVGYNGKSAGHSFVDGVAEIDENDPQINYFLAAGYTVGGEVRESDGAADPSVPDSGVDPAPKPLSRLKVDELRALAAQRGVQVPEGATKPDLVDLLKGRDAADPDESQEQMNPNLAADEAAEGEAPPAGTSYGNPAAGTDEENRDVQGEQK